MSNHVLIWASRFIELAAFMVFLNKVPLRREGSLMALLELVLFSVLLVLVRDLCGLLWDRYPELLYINLFYYPCVWCFVRLRYDLKWRQTIYYVLMLFLGVQSLRLLLHLLSNSLCGTDYFNVFTEESLPMNLLWLSLYWGTLVLTFRLLKKYAVSGSISDLNNYSLLMMTVIAVPVFFLGDSVVWVKEPGLRLCCAVMGEVSSICGIVGITGYLNLQALEKQKLELARMEGILESQDRRQRMELENIASLNRRYHDLKNHMLYFRQQGLTPEGREYIADVEREIENTQRSFT